MISFVVHFQETDWLGVVNNAVSRLSTAINGISEIRDINQKAQIEGLFSTPDNDFVNQVFPNSKFQGNIFQVAGAEINDAMINGGIDSARDVLTRAKQNISIVADGISGGMSKNNALGLQKALDFGFSHFDEAFNQMQLKFDAGQIQKANIVQFQNAFQNASSPETLREVWNSDSVPIQIKKSELKNKFVSAVRNGDVNGLKSLSQAVGDETIFDNGVKAIQQQKKQLMSENMLETKSLVLSGVNSLNKNPNSIESRATRGLLDGAFGKENTFGYVFGGQGQTLGDVNLYSWNTKEGVSANKKHFADAVKNIDVSDNSDKANALRILNGVVQGIANPSDVQELMKKFSNPVQNYSVEEDSRFRNSDGEFDENLVNGALKKISGVDTTYQNIRDYCSNNVGSQFGGSVVNQVVQTCLSDELGKYGISPVTRGYNKAMQTVRENGGHVLLDNINGGNVIVDKSGMTLAIEDGKSFLNRLKNDAVKVVNQEKNIKNDAKQLVGKLKGNDFLGEGAGSIDGVRWDEDFLNGFVSENLNNGNVGYMGNYKKVLLASNLNHIKIPDSIEDPDAFKKMILMMKDWNNVEITKDKDGNPAVKYQGKSIPEYLYPSEFELKKELKGKKNVSSVTVKNKENTAIFPEIKKKDNKKVIG